MSAGIGVYKPNVDRQSRINWLTDARTLLEGESIPWSFFNDMGDFSGLTGTAGQRTFDPSIASALFAP